MAPALLVVALVAVYPLGSGIVKSLTDEIFASDQAPHYIGLRNYESLLSVTVRVVHPLRDPTTGAVMTDAATGRARYPRPEDVLPHYARYRLTEDALTGPVSAAMPPDALKKTRPLLNREYDSPDQLSAAVAAAVGPLPGRTMDLLSASYARRTVRYSLLAQISLPRRKVFVGAQNPEFISATLNTIAFAVITVAIELILSTLLAVILQKRFRGRGVIRALMLVPWAVPTAISSRMWSWMFNSTRTGFFNVVLQALGLGGGQIPFLEVKSAQLPIMCIIDVWKTTPFMTLLLLAGLQLIPGELYEAAAVDGVGGARRFWRITLPLLRQTIAVALVFRTLDALRVFDLFQIVLGESRYSMASFTYYQLIQNRAAGYSAASGVVIFVLVFCFAVLYVRALGLQAAGDQE